MAIKISSFDTLWTVSESIDSPVAQAPVSIVADDSGYVFVGGSVKTPTGSKMVVLKYSPSGHRLWQAAYDSIGMNSLAVAMTLTDGQVVTTGFSFDSIGHSNFTTFNIDRNTGLVNLVDIVPCGAGAISHPVSIVSDAAGSTYIAGTATVAGAASVIKIVKYDSLFHYVWSTTFGDSSQTNVAAAMISDGIISSNLYLTGTVPNASGGTDILLVAYGPDGTLYGSRTISAPNPANIASGRDIISDGNGNTFITGVAYNGSDTDIVTAGYDINGDLMWQKTYQRAAGTNDMPFNIGVSGDGSTVYVTTQSQGTDTVYNLISYEQWKPSPCGDTICPEINYGFQNWTISSSGVDSFIEFDIYVKQNESKNFWSANIMFTYDKNVFGSHLVDSGNFILTRGIVTADSNYVLTARDTSFPSDILITGKGEILLHVIAQNTSPLYNIENIRQQFCHVKMKMKRKAVSLIQFDQFFMQNQSFFLDEDVTSYTYVHTAPPFAAASGDEIIDLKIENIRVEHCTAVKTLEFDVFAKARSSGTRMGELFFSYGRDTLALGYSSATLAGRYRGPYSTTVTAGANPDWTKVEVLGVNTATFVVVPSTWDTLVHISIDIDSCGLPPGVYADTSMYPYGERWQGALGYAHYHVSFVDSINVPLCFTASPPVVTGYSPACISSGSFEVLTIYGSGFGCDTGTVWFTDADSSGGFTPTLKQDIRQWTDNQIELLVPTHPRVAGSGIYYVQTAAGDSTLAAGDSITIGYANFNVRNNSNLLSPDYNKTQFMYLQSAPFVFQLSTNLYNTPGAMRTIQHAIENINCQTGVNFQLDTSGPSMATGPLPTDHISLISILPNTSAEFSDPYTLAHTAIDRRYQNCYTNLPQYNNRSLILQEADISIMDVPYTGTWLWADSILPDSTQFDFGTVIIHELGHAALLLHTLPVKRIDGNVMNPYTPQGKAMRIYDNDHNSILGIRHMLEMGTTLAAAGCDPAAVQFYPPGCPTIYARPCGVGAGIEPVLSSGETFSAHLYPNPYEHNSAIHIETTKWSTIGIAVYDVLGNIVWQTKQASGTPFDISISDFEGSTGIYLITVTDGYNSKVLKMTKF